MRKKYNILPHGSYTVDDFIDMKTEMTPGAHLVAMFGPTKYHSVVCDIEDAGFEIRDMITYLTADGLTLIALCRVPLSEKTVAQNVLKHGTGGLNIDECRVCIDPIADKSQRRELTRGIRPTNTSWGMNTVKCQTSQVINMTGRFPANLIHDGSDEIVGLFPLTAKSSGKPRNNNAYKSQSKGADTAHVTHGYDDQGGSASRFFKTCETEDELVGYLKKMIGA